MYTYKPGLGWILEVQPDYETYYEGPGGRLHIKLEIRPPDEGEYYYESYKTDNETMNSYLAWHRRYAVNGIFKCYSRIDIGKKYITVVVSEV